ncbi:MAG: hypothetical protein QM831_30160 [Kofleriaceae bacterium]
MLWLAADDLPESREVTRDDIVATARSRKQAIEVTGRNATWRASLPGLEFAIDNGVLVVDTKLDDKAFAFMGKLAELTGPFGLVVGDAAVAAFSARGNASDPDLLHGE